jgi:hypothetical protein
MRNARIAPKPRVSHLTASAPARHGDRCSRLHNKPTISQTLLMPNMYQSPATVMTPAGPAVTDPRQLQEHFEARAARLAGSAPATPA